MSDKEWRAVFFIIFALRKGYWSWSRSLAE